MDSRAQRSMAVAARIVGGGAWAGGELQLNRPTVHQIPCGLVLQDHSITEIPFCLLPSSGGGRRREQEVVASFAKTQPLASSSSNAPPA
jgi:hypothetical protein